MRLGNLLKKELKELLTVQAIFSMVFTCVLLMFMGQVMGGAMDEAINNSTVNILDKDGSEFTSKMLEQLSEYGADPNIVTFSSDNYAEEMAALDIKNMVIIPEGFGDSIVNGTEQVQLEYISAITSGGLSSSMTELSASSMTGAISAYVSDYTEQVKFELTEQQQQLISEPVVIVEYTAANGRTANVPAEALSAMMMSQSMIAPMAIFFLVLMASQMIMTAISTEKIDKTLETLLSAPVSRITVLSAKMIAALIVALLNAGSMVIGFAFYMKGMLGSAMDEMTTDLAADPSTMSIADGMAQLGLSLSGSGMVIFAVELFLTIAIGLSISLILGAMATDVKSVQTLVMPIMMLTMIPFFVTMFMDVNTLPSAFKVIMYIIPFTHTYTAMNNMMFGHMGLVWFGLIYQIIFFVVCMYLAVRVFTTDLLFTMNFSLDSGVKKKGGLFGGNKK